MVSDALVLPRSLTISHREEDVARIEALVKADILAFYEQYINPASAQCARLVAHLKRQARVVKVDGEPVESVLPGESETAMRRGRNKTASAA